MKPDKSTLLSRKMGTLPDQYWYQLNGKSAQENFQEQHEQMYSALTEDDDYEIRIVSEVKQK